MRISFGYGKNVKTALHTSIKRFDEDIYTYDVEKKHTGENPQATQSDGYVKLQSLTIDNKSMSSSSLMDLLFIFS
jgi:hypothetical protein